MACLIANDSLNDEMEAYADTPDTGRFAAYPHAHRAVSLRRMHGRHIDARDPTLSTQWRMRQ